MYAIRSYYEGIELRRAYMERQSELFALAPKLADALNYAVNQAMSSTPLLVNPLMSASQSLVSARTSMMRYLLTTTEADAKLQQQALQTAQAAIQMAAGLAGETPIEGVVDSVAQMMNTYESSASLLMALAQRSNVITSYSIHYTKLYESAEPPRSSPRRRR